jgi:hypothetical protein
MPQQCCLTSANSRVVLVLNRKREERARSVACLRAFLLQVTEVDGSSASAARVDASAAAAALVRSSR